MISDHEVKQIFETIMHKEGSSWEFLGSAIVGSSLRPEFMHVRSDIDLYFIVKPRFGQSTRVDVRGWTESNSVENRIEYTVCCFETYISKITSGELTLPFALVLGYSNVAGEPELFTVLHSLSVKRFNVLFEKFISDHKNISFDEEFSKLITFINDLISTLDIERLKTNKILHFAKCTFLLKCLIINYYKLTLLRKSNAGNEIPFAIKASFFMINEERSFRLFDFEKYELDPSVEELIRNINEFVGSKNCNLTSLDLQNIVYRVSMPFYSAILESRI